MALLKLSSLVNSIRGSIGGLTFSHDKSGIHLLKKISKLKRISTGQKKVRSAYASSIGLWNQNKSTPGFVSSWGTYATYPETAINAFIRINWFHFYNDVDPLLIPPG